MNVTYCVSPLYDFKTYTTSSRILTTNLLNDDRFNVSFNYFVLQANKESEKMSYDSEIEIRKVDPVLSLSYSTWMKWMQFFYSVKVHPEKFSNTIKDDIVFMSCAAGHNFDYAFVVPLLNQGKKVILGGSNFRFWSNEDYVRKTLSEMGVKSKYLNNFIIISGFADLNTDLYSIVKNWKSTTIKNNDFRTIWDCNSDYLSNVIRTGSKILGFTTFSSLLKENYTQAIFLLNNKCWYRKCKFCTYHLLPKMFFDEGVSANKIANHMINICNLFGTNQIYICNDYFVFNKKNKEILDILKKNNKMITIFSGIKLLQNDRYLDNINKYIDYIKIGLESGTDFALEYIKKGYTLAEAEMTFEKMAKVLDKNISISWNVITDLPQQSTSEVKRNYENLLKIKRILSDFVNVQTTGLSLTILSLNDVMIDNQYIRPVDKDYDKICGRSYVYDILSKITDTDKHLYNDITPFGRYDKDGNPMLPDYKIVDPEVYQEIFGWWGWKGKELTPLQQKEIGNE